MPRDIRNTDKLHQINIKYELLYMFFYIFLLFTFILFFLLTFFFLFPLPTLSFCIDYKY